MFSLFDAILAKITFWSKIGKNYLLQLFVKKNIWPQSKTKQKQNNKQFGVMSLTACVPSAHHHVGRNKSEVDEGVQQ